MDRSRIDSNLFDRLSRFSKDEDVSNAERFTSNSALLEESRRRLLASNEPSGQISMSRNGDNVGGNVVTVRSLHGSLSFQRAAANYSGTATAIPSGYLLIQAKAAENSRRVEPLFPARPESPNSTVSTGMAISSRLPQPTGLGQQKEDSGAIGCAPKRENTRHLWTSKIHLQAACGADPTENLRMNEVISLSVETIRNLETEDLERRTEITNLMKQQAHLLDRVAYYKKLYV